MATLAPWWRSVLLLVLLREDLLVVHAQTCVLTWQISASEDLLQTCTGPSTAINVVANNDNIINVFGGGGTLEVLEGADATDRTAILNTFDQYPDSSILAVVVEDNQDGTVNILPNDSGPNTGCRDNASGNSLVTVGQSFLESANSVFNAYANGGVVFIALMIGSGGTINGPRRQRWRRRELTTGRQRALPSKQELFLGEVSLLSLAAELEAEQRAEALKASLQPLTKENFLQEEASLLVAEDNKQQTKRRLDDANCEQSPNGFETICWWLDLTRDSGRDQGVSDCMNTYGCPENPCPPDTDGTAVPVATPIATPVASPIAQPVALPPVFAPAMPVNRPTDKPVKKPSKDNKRCDLGDTECCLDAVADRCNCGLFVRGDPCYWKIAKRRCLPKMFKRPMMLSKKEKKKYEKKEQQQQARVMQVTKKNYRAWCIEQVQNGVFPGIDEEDDGDDESSEAPSPGDDNPFDVRRRP